MSHKRIAGFSFSYVMRVGLAAVIFILFLKWTVNRFGPAGAKRVANAI